MRKSSKKSASSSHRSHASRLSSSVPRDSSPPTESPVDRAIRDGVAKAVRREGMPEVTTGADLMPEPIPPLSTEDQTAEGSLSRDPSDPAVDRGHQAPTFEGDDENDVGERLVTEGVEEADSDQRHAAHRLRQPD